MSNGPINFARTFGATEAPAAAAANQRVPAQVWVNIGYNVDVPDGEGGTTTMFVSLPVGIPLDTSDALELKGRNANFLAFQKARNDLRDQLLAHAKGMKPGEEVIINDLEIQLRRVSDPVNANDVASGDANPFSRTLELSGS
jgi:hypothetical protein